MSVPAQERILGTAAAENGNTLFWNHAKVWSALRGNRSMAVCMTQVGRFTSAFFAGTPSPLGVTIGIVDAATHRALRSTNGHPCTPWFQLPRLPGTLLDATWIEGRLRVLTREVFSGLVVSAVDTLGHLVGSFSVHVARELSTTLDWAYLARVGNRIAVGSHRSPAWWIEFDSNGTERIQSSGVPRLALEGRGIPSNALDLFSSPVLRIGDLFAQTITELTSRRRFLAFFNSRGDFLRIAEREMGLALVASLPGDSLVLGIDRSRQEIVIYARTP